MRVLFIILMILGFLGSGILGLFSAKFDGVEEDYKAAKELLESDAAKLLPDDQKAEMEAELAQREPGKINMTIMLGFVTGLLMLVFVILTFMKKDKIALMVGGGAVVVALVLWIVCPDIDGGEGGGANPKMLAVIGLVSVIVSVGSGVLSAKFRKPKPVEA